MNPNWRRQALREKVDSVVSESVREPYVPADLEAQVRWLIGEDDRLVLDSLPTTIDPEDPHFYVIHAEDEIFLGEDDLREVEAEFRRAAVMARTQKPCSRPRDRTTSMQPALRGVQAMLMNAGVEIASDRDYLALPTTPWRLGNGDGIHRLDVFVEPPDVFRDLFVAPEAAGMMPRSSTVLSVVETDEEGAVLFDGMACRRVCEVPELVTVLRDLGLSKGQWTVDLNDGSVSDGTVRMLESTSDSEPGGLRALIGQVLLKTAVQAVVKTELVEPCLKEVSEAEREDERRAIVEVEMVDSALATLTVHHTQYEHTVLHDEVVRPAPAEFFAIVAEHPETYIFRATWKVDENRERPGMDVREPYPVGDFGFRYSKVFNSSGNDVYLPVHQARFIDAAGIVINDVLRRVGDEKGTVVEVIAQNIDSRLCARVKAERVHSIEGRTQWIVDCEGKTASVVQGHTSSR